VDGSSSGNSTSATKGSEMSGVHDGRNGFVVYESYVTLINATTLPTLDSYARYESSRSWTCSLAVWC